jgi:hypothetical protein
LLHRRVHRAEARSVHGKAALFDSLGQHFVIGAAEPSQVTVADDFRQALLFDLRLANAVKPRPRMTALMRGNRTK